MFNWFGKVSYCPHTKVAEFARHLKDGRLMGSKCDACGKLSFPPRADCPACRHDAFTYTEMSGKGTVLTYTRIDAAPAGFEDETPFTVGVVDLEETGRLLAWFGETIAETDIRVDMPVQVVPRMFEESKDIKVYYTLEKPGTDWVKSDSS
ncbi:Zn-ribbon domain-containing OB-fold protein [bacterium]|nr:Zn-ribbon domain-containing OB-fold protein [bacterium]